MHNYDYVSVVMESPRALLTLENRKCDSEIYLEEVDNLLKVSSYVGMSNLGEVLPKNGIAQVSMVSSCSTTHF